MVRRVPITSLFALLLTLGLGAAAEDEALQATLDDMRALADVLGHVQRDYVDQTSDHRLLEDAIRGMLASLDPHTAYLNREELADLEADTSGRYGGIGIEVEWRDEDLTVVKLVAGGPADRAGVARGDVIRAVGAEAVNRSNSNDIIHRVRGEPGTAVSLTIATPGGSDPRQISIIRELITVESVEGRLLDGHYAYLKIIGFQTDTAEAVSAELERIEDLAGEELKGLVLDLRSNPGGVLNAAVDIADLFLERGLIVSTRGRREGSLMSYNAAPEDRLHGAPIAVLVDHGTASASEILAGALQDHGRAYVLGQTTFGKGSVQTVLPLRNGGAIKLTTSRYYTPSGRSIQAEGIHPDIDLAGETSETPEPLRDLAAETGLSGQWERDLPERDYPLYRALAVLKGVQILGRLEE